MGALLSSRGSRLSGSNNAVIFSLEIFELISDSLFEMTPPTFLVQNESICCIKPKWNDVVGFTSVNRALHKIGMTRWMRVAIVRGTEDWEHIIKYSHCVRELRCLDGAFSPSHRTILLRFPRLYAVSIDAHGDVVEDNAGRLAYNDIFTTLPKSLRRLGVECAHGADANVIQIARRDCPSLEELKLGRCTIFNRSAACPFWRRLPFDHDAYMSLDGTEKYACCLATELSPMKHLTTLHLGIYLIPSMLLLDHKIFHVRDQTAPEGFSWQEAFNQFDTSPIVPEATPTDRMSRFVSFLHQPTEGTFDIDSCYHCKILASHLGSVAGQAANAIIQGNATSLTTVSWMNWFSQRHLGSIVYAQCDA